MAFFRTKTPYIPLSKKSDIDIDYIKLDSSDIDDIKKWFTANPNETLYSASAYNVIKLKDKERYIVYSEKTFLGKGSAGRVYLAYDATQSCFVALKVYRPITVDHTTLEEFKKSQSTMNEKIDQKLRHINTEVNMLRKATDATTDQVCSTVACSGMDEKNKLIPVTIMPLEEGQDLFDTLYIPLSSARLLQLAINICNSLKKLHAKKILHRDIKLENIMLNYLNGNTRLVDHELSVECDENLEYKSTKLCGTPTYIALDIKQPDNTYKYTSKSDTHALAVTLGMFFKFIEEDEKFDSQSDAAKESFPDNLLRAELSKIILSMMTTEIKEGDQLMLLQQFPPKDHKEDTSPETPPPSKISCSLDDALLQLNGLRSRFFPERSYNMKKTVLLDLNEFLSPDNWSPLLDTLKKGGFQEVQFIVTDDKGNNSKNNDSKNSERKNTDDNIAIFRRYLESNKLVVGKTMYKEKNFATALRKITTTQHNTEQKDHDKKTDIRYKTQIPRSYFVVSGENKTLLTAAQSSVCHIRTGLVDLNRINAHVDSHRISEHQAEFSITPFQAEINRLINAYGNNNDEKTVTNATVIRRISAIKAWIEELRSEKRPTYANLKSKLSALQTKMKRTKGSILSSLFPSKGAKNIEAASQQIISRILSPVNGQ